MTVFTARSSHQSRDVLLKKCSKKFRKFHRKRPLLEFLFKRPAGLTPILKNMCQRLLLCCTRTTRCYLSVLLLLLISPMFNWFKFKRLQRVWILFLIFNEGTFISVIFFFHVCSVFLSLASIFLVAANKKDSFNWLKCFCQHWRH